MSKYTTEVRFICEQAYGKEDSVGYSSINDIITVSASKIFDFDFPIFDENYRKPLEVKILRHFYTREIGLETVGLWKHFLNMKMNEIMPYYNQIYDSTLLKFNPLLDVDYEVKRNSEISGNKNDIGNTTSNSNSDTKNTASVNNNNDRWEYYSDTPQGGINGLQNQNYLTNATNNKDDLKETTNGTTNYSDENKINNTLNSVINNTEDYIENVTGKRNGENYSKMLQDFRNTFVNIDLQIIHECDDLFLNLW